MEITGWRKSLERTAAFYFTDLGDSYAARTGRPQNVGVIGVAVFQERPKRICLSRTGSARRGSMAAEAQPAMPSAKNEAHADAAVAASASAPAQAGARDAGAAEEFARQESKDQTKALSASSARATAATRNRACTVTQFDRATRIPGGNGGDPVRPSREPDRDGRAAATHAVLARRDPEPISRRAALRARSQVENF